VNRQNLRLEVLDYADAVGSGRWDATAGATVDKRIGSVFDNIWRDILNANPYYRIGQRTPTSDSAGNYSIASLTVGSEDTLERFYRVVGMVVDGYPIDGPVSFKDWGPRQLIGNAVSQRVWYQNGSNLTVLPLQPLKTADAIWVNWIPQRMESLAGEDSEVDFPEGHLEVLIGFSAARLLTKAGAETDAALEIKAELAPDYRALLADIARIGTNPLTIAYSDDSADWGV
jgi:hypothetical protein